MLILKTLEITNFRSYKHLLLEDIDTLGLTLVSGSNGSGKSTIRNAIEYLLTDTTSESIPLDEYALNGEGNCVLRCVIQKDDDTIEIIKYRDHKKKGNSTILSVNGVSDNHTESDRRETQRNIFRLLDITKELLPISSIFSQHSQSFANSKESDRKKIIYDALNLHKYTNYADLARIEEGELSVLLEGQNSRVSVIETDIEDLKSDIEEKKIKSVEFDIERKKELEELEEDKETRIKEYENEKKRNIKELEEEKTTLVNIVEKIKRKINKDKHTYRFLQQEIRKFDSKDNIEKKKDSFVLSRNELLYKKRNIELQLSKVKDSTCPILEEYCIVIGDKAKDTIEKLVPKLHEIDEEVKKIDIEINILLKILNEIEILSSDIDKLHEEINENEQESNLTQEEITNIDDKIGCILEDNGEGLKEVIKLLDTRIEDIRNKENTYEILLEDTNKLLDNKRQRLDESKRKIKEAEELIKYYNFWKVGYGKAGIPNMKAEGFLSSIEFETNKILSTISDRMFVEISSQYKLKSKSVSEKVSYKIHHPDKTITDFSSYSGGEKQRVMLSDIFAFNKLLSKLNLAILDEVLEMSLDATGKSDTLRLLRDKVNDIGTILVVSHSNQIKDSFDTVLEIEKTNGVSKCVRK